MGAWPEPVGATGCGSGPTAGALVLEAALLARHSAQGAASLGIFNCRKIAGSDEWSTHAEGRAVDLYVGWPPEALGQLVLAELVNAPHELGLQRVMYNGWIHDARTPGGRPDGGEGAHTTHLHVELSWRGADDLQLVDAVDALALLDDDDQEDAMGLLVTSGGTIWVVAVDLSSRTGLHASADVSALLATGWYKAVALSPGTFADIPIARTDDM